MESNAAAPTSPWNFEGHSPSLQSSGPLFTLVEGRSFCISTSAGDITNVGPQGMFFLDTRFIKNLLVMIDGTPLETLGLSSNNPYEADFVSRHIGSGKSIADTPTIAVRSRQVGQGMVEKIEIRNHGENQSTSLVSLVLDADFAGLFSVKEEKAPVDPKIVREIRGDKLWFAPLEDDSRGLEVSSKVKPDLIETGRFNWTVNLEPGETWQTTVEFAPWLQGKPVGPDRDESKLSPSARLNEWQDKVPQVQSSNSKLQLCTTKALQDLASLRIFDASSPDTPVVAAGAPWFMTLFGRDSLIASWMALIVDPDLASGVVQTLARYQGKEVNSRTEEAPGKIMHEMRFSGATSTALDEGELYYGTADATPLFVMLLGELQRWGAAADVVTSLIPNADRALDWITNYGDSDGDGYVEYQRSTESGLANQGWKDSGDGIRYNDGRIAQAPIALCEVQAYTYAAYRARARLAESVGDPQTSQKWETKATELRQAFNRDFWLEDKGWFAVGLDGDKKPIDSLTSNIGHCLWSGIIDEPKAEQVAKHLMSDSMFTGWGVRTMAKNTPGYNPTGYHVGSVWPHDSAIVAAGLMEYGFVDESLRLIKALIDTGAATEGRLPELMAGFDRSEFNSPMAYPASCSPQAWAAGAPLLMLRSMLRLEPWYAKKRVWVDPVIPEEYGQMKITGIPIGDSRFSITVEGGEFETEGLPSDIECHRGFRPNTPRERWTETN